MSVDCSRDNKLTRFCYKLWCLVLRQLADVRLFNKDIICIAGFFVLSSTHQTRHGHSRLFLRQQRSQLLLQQLIFILRLTTAMSNGIEYDETKQNQSSLLTLLSTRCLHKHLVIQQFSQKQCLYGAWNYSHCFTFLLRFTNLVVKLYFTHTN